MLRLIKIFACVSILSSVGMLFFAPALALPHNSQQLMQSSQALIIAGQGDKPKLGF